ncbi:MAG TPA: chromate transporter [Acidimicrobiales bacterium]|nr:chromate transporter [Acidimicrobiales bacterium]
MSRVPLATIAREWGRIGCIGFGGPPAHIALLRRMCVDERRWLEGGEFEDAVAAVNLLPGPASTQLAIYCAWRLRGGRGALVGGLCFICPGLVCILLLSWLFLAGHPPLWVRGAAAGAAAAVPVVAARAACGLLPASWRRAAGEPAPAPAPCPSGPAGSAHPPERDDLHPGTARRAKRSTFSDVPAVWRWATWLAAGTAAGALSTPWLVLVLVVAGLLEMAVRRRQAGTQGDAGAGRGPGALGLAGPVAAAFRVAATRPGAGRVAAIRVAAGRVAAGRPGAGRVLGSSAALAGAGGLGALAWVAFKIGALSYGGGFVIVPLMQHDAVDTYHWMTGTHFLDAVALGQVTPGPVVQTVAAVGYAAHGLGGGLLAASIAFAPSFAFVLAGGPHLGRLRKSAGVQGFFAGAGPAAIGAIAGSAIPLARDLPHLWQLGVLGAALLWLLALRRGVVSGIVGAAAAGVAAALAGAPLPH